MRERLGAGVLLLTLLGTSACEYADPVVPPPSPSAAAALLKDVVIATLPSPYYHFEYDAAGRVAKASFASGMAMYEVLYDGDRIAELRNNTVENHDRLEYDYDDSARVSAVRYVGPDGTVSTAVFLRYDGPRLTGLERDRRVEGGFIVDKTMSLSYYPDGNLLEIREHRPAIDGRQIESTMAIRFEQYDEGVNVDAFGLLHNDSLDHLILLPGVRLQEGNPRRATIRTDALDAEVAYAYTYDERNRPLTKQGAIRITIGSDVLPTYHTLSEFSYY